MGWQMPDLRHWKIKGNNFYRKKIGDLGSHKSTKFTRDKMLVHKALTSLFFFDDLEEIDGVDEIKEFKQTVMIQRPYQCGNTVYQLVKLQMLEFCYHFLDKYLNR